MELITQELQKDVRTLYQEVHNIKTQIQNQNQIATPNIVHQNLDHYVDTVRNIPWYIHINLIISNAFLLQTTALVDTGAQSNCIQEHLVPNQYFEPTSHRLSGANGSRLNVHSKLTNVKICINDFQITQTFFLVQNLNTEIILGQPFLNSIKPFSVDDTGISTNVFGHRIVFLFIAGMDKSTNQHISPIKDGDKTDQNPVNVLASPQQTARGKGTSNPLWLESLPKRPQPKTQLPVFRTNHQLEPSQHRMLNQLLQHFQNSNKAGFIATMHQIAQNMAQPKFNLDYESSCIPHQSLTQESWLTFHQNLANQDTRWPPTITPVPSSVPGFYQCNIQANHPQHLKLWLYEMGFIKNLWTDGPQDLYGLPEILIHAIKGFHHLDHPVRLKFITIPPEWIKDGQYQEFIPTTNYIRIIPRSDAVWPAITSPDAKSNIQEIRTASIYNFQNKLSCCKGQVIAEGQRTIITSPLKTPKDAHLAYSINNNQINASLAVTRLLDQNNIDFKWNYWDSDNELESHISPSYGSPDGSSYSFDTIGEANITNMMEG